MTLKSVPTIPPEIRIDNVAKSTLGLWCEFHKGLLTQENAFLAAASFSALVLLHINGFQNVQPETLKKFLEEAAMRVSGQNTPANVQALEQLIKEFKSNV